MWQFQFLSIQRNDNGGKGPRKGNLNHLKGRGTSGDIMIDRKRGFFWPYWQQEKQDFLLNVKECGKSKHEIFHQIGFYFNGVNELIPEKLVELKVFLKKQKNK